MASKPNLLLLLLACSARQTLSLTLTEYLAGDDGSLRDTESRESGFAGYRWLLADIAGVNETLQLVMYRFSLFHLGLFCPVVFVNNDTPFHLSASIYPSVP